MNLKSTAVLTALAGALLASTAPLYAADVSKRVCMRCLRS